MEHSVEIKNALCIICLDPLNDSIIDACDTCEVKCHIKCLYEWYKTNNMEICPICLKKNKTISIINNDLYEENEEVIQEYENIVRNQNTTNEINENRNRNNILQIDEDLRRYYELRKVLMMITCIFIFCIILLKILLN
tara:strand:- start:111 stop:524 length:414 start_codon:yes stop_codon:yes gene_type:complete